MYLKTFTAEVNTRISDLAGNQPGWYWPSFKAYKDMIVAFGPSGFSMSVWKRNSTGGYKLLTLHTFPNVKIGMENFADLDTNGEWASITYCYYQMMTYSYIMILELFKFSENGTILEVQRPTWPAGITFEYGRFQSDGSFVCISTSATGTGSWASRTKSAGMYKFQLVNGNWTMTNKFIFSEHLGISSAVGNDYYDFVFSKASFQFDNNHFVAGDGSNIYIYQLSSNATSWIWTIKDSLHFALYADSISWNGDDAIMVGMATWDTVFLLTKNASGSWNQQDSTFPTGYPNVKNLFGYTSVAFNKDTFLVSEAIYQTATTTGKVLIVQRRSGSWAIVGAFEGPYWRTFFGATIAITDLHILVDGDMELHAIPRCFIEPDYYDCPTTLTSCNNFTDFDASLVCTAKDPLSQCSSLPVSTNVTNVSVINDTTYISFETTRFGTPPHDVTVAIQCIPPAPSEGTPDSTNPSSSPNTSSVTSGGQATRLSQAVAVLFILGIVC